MNNFARKPFALFAFASLLGGAVSCGEPEQGADRGPDIGNLDGGGGTGGSGGSGTEGGAPRKTCRDVLCDPNATCSGAGAQATCACIAGFTGDGVHCTDVNECAAGGMNDCDPNATCTNRSGGFLCQCKDGFVGDGKTCTAVDQCAAGNNVCDPNAVCSTGGDAGAPACTCKAGFTGDGIGCGDVNECMTAGTFSCAANARCVNTFGGFTCACNAGFQGDGNTACTALCDAAKMDANTCGANALCRVKNGSGVCDACEPGYIGNGKTCTQSACGAACDGMGADDAPHAVCSMGGTCACAPGYDGTPGSCTDQNECATNNGGCGDHADCTNLDGGFLCACKAGYARDANNQCVDVDECAAMPSPCHPDATCTNKTPEENPAGFACQCKDGFTGDGFTCSDVNECATNHGGCAADSTCVNKRGGFSCDCAPPLVGQAGSCHCDLSGLWAMRLDVDLCWKAVPIQEGSGTLLIAGGSTEATDWELHEMTYDGTTVNVRKKSCGTDNPPDIVSPLFKEVYSTFIPFSVADTTELTQGTPFMQPGIVPGTMFTTPQEALVTGIDLGPDPVNAPWPPAHGAVVSPPPPPINWLDTENDGIPGETLWPKVPSSLTHSGTSHYSYLPVRPTVDENGTSIDQRVACVSAAGREITHLQANVESCTRITGKVLYDKEDTRVHSCTIVPKGTCSSSTSCTGWTQDVTCTAADWQNGTPCSDDDLSRVDDQRGSQLLVTASTFELVRVGAVTDTVTCSDVRTQFPAFPHTVPTISCTAPQ